MAEAYLASRVLSNFDGMLEDCNTVSGEVAGPGPDGYPTTDGHAGGCLRTTGEPCTAEETASLESGGTSAAQRIWAVTS